MNLQRHVEKLATVYLDSGASAAHAALQELCKREGIYGWTKMFLLAKVRGRIKDLTKKDIRSKMSL